MTEIFTMQELLCMTSEDLKSLKDSAWETFINFDTALKAVIEMEKESEKNER